MRKIRHYEGDCFKFHQDVVERKKSEQLKEHLRTISDVLKEQYDKYGRAFAGDNLPSLHPLIFDATTKKELESLYSYDAQMFRRLKRILTVDENQRPDVYCPNCTINTINSFDHYLPQTEFSEYIDNPLNLIPSCTECNGHKNKVWRMNGERLFLNLYIDDMPQIQYLFVTLSISDNGTMVDAKFEVRNPDGKIDVGLYNKISYHYKKLLLCERFSEHRESVLSSLANEIYTLKEVLSDNALKEVIMKSVANERVKYGYNYWRAILQEAVCDNQTVFDFFKRKPY